MAKAEEVPWLVQLETAGKISFIDNRLLWLLQRAGDEWGPLDLDLDLIEARLDAATPGPWHVTVDPLGIHVENGDGAGRIVMRAGQDRGDGDGCGDARFIAAARQDVPELVAEVRRLRAVLSAAPWSDTDRELVADVLREAYEEARAQDQVAGKVLDALTAAGWAPEEAQWERTFRETENLNRMEQSARSRERVRIAAAIRATIPQAGRPAATRYAEWAARIARAHRTIPTEECRDG